MSYRRPIFEPGESVRVKSDFRLGSTFREGEVLVFQRDGYSRYDNSFVYEFLNATGELKSWYLHEDKPIDLWRDFFEPIPDRISN